jgi:hypothetical protein
VCQLGGILQRSYMGTSCPKCRRVVQQFGTLVTGLVGERGLGAVQPDVLEGRLCAARAVVANERTSTDELRAAFIELRAVFDARLDGAAFSPELRS